METARSYKTLVSLYQIIRHHITEECHFLLLLLLLCGGDGVPILQNLWKHTGVRIFSAHFRQDVLSSIFMHSMQFVRIQVKQFVCYMMSMH
jgi:hypothetical protein